RDTVSSLGVPDLRELHGRAYHPWNIVVAAAGHVEHDALLEALAQTGWADVPRGPESSLAPTPSPVTAPPARHLMERDSTQTHVVFGSPTVRHGDPRRY